MPEPTREFKLTRRVESFSLDDLQKWMAENPDQKVSFDYCEGGWSNIAAEPGHERPWRLLLLSKRRGMPLRGYCHNSLKELVWALCTNQQ